MKIKEITYQHRRDFQAIYECEHCGHEQEEWGYDDSYFHKEVVPRKVCGVCGKNAPEGGYSPLATKYPDDKQV